MKKYSLYLLIILIRACLVLGEKRIREKHESFKEMLEAKNLMIKLSKVIYLEKVNRGINMSRKLDTLESGLIGEEFIGITTPRLNLWDYILSRVYINNKNTFKSFKKTHSIIA